MVTTNMITGALLKHMSLVQHDSELHHRTKRYICMSQTKKPHHFKVPGVGDEERERKPTAD